MVKTTSLLRGTALAILLCTPALGQEADLSTVVATVGKTEITVAHVLDVKRQLPQQYQTLADDVLFGGIVDQLVQQQLLAQTVETAPAWIATSLENERRNLLSTTVLDDVRAMAVTDEALQAEYQVLYQSDSPEQEFNAAHILVETAAEAEALVAQLTDGADFAELAKEHSTGPSGPRGGDLGWFGMGQMVPEFETAVTGMDVGGVVGPVKTQFGFHVITLKDSRAVTPPTFEDSKEELELKLQNAAVQAKIATLMADNTVTKPDVPVDPSVLTTLSLTGDK